MSTQDYYDWQRGYWANHASEWEQWAEMILP